MRSPSLSSYDEIVELLLGARLTEAVLTAAAAAAPLLELPLPLLLLALPLVSLPLPLLLPPRLPLPTESRPSGWPAQ